MESLTSLSELRQGERRKYEYVYRSSRDRRIEPLSVITADDIQYWRAADGLMARKPAGYGHGFHGRHACKLIESLAVGSIVDIGCGGNEFVTWARGIGIDALGIDFASPFADICASAHALPLRAGRFEWLTAFDVLEHLRPEEVDSVLHEFRRVSRRGWIFSISFRDSTKKVNGQTLHPTVRPRLWWEEKISEYITIVKATKFRRYIFGRLR